MDANAWKALTGCKVCRGRITSNETTVIDRNPVRGELWSTTKTCENGHVDRRDTWLREDQIAVAD